MAFYRRLVNDIRCVLIRIKHDAKQESKKGENMETAHSSQVLKIGVVDESLDDRDGIGHHSKRCKDVHAKIVRRLVPILVLLYIVSFMDRTNIAFAKDALHHLIGLDDSAFALGAGLFFLTYCFFELPANLVMLKVGARVWLAAITIAWGAVTLGIAFVTGPKLFYLMRLLLGAAESGLFPGVILYITWWLPNARRAKIIGLFYCGAPIASIIGGPIASTLLQLHGYFGLSGPQWLFIVEGSIAIFLGAIAYVYLRDHPDSAEWLSEEERVLLSEEIAQQQILAKNESRNTYTRSLLTFSVGYFCLYICIFGIIFYIPMQIARSLGSSINLNIGLLSTIPWFAALGALLYFPALAEKTGKQRQLIRLLMTACTAGICLSTINQTIIIILGLSIAVAAFTAVQPIMWTFPTRLLRGKTAAAGIATINAIGLFGGFFGPILRNAATGVVSIPQAGVWLLAIFSAISAALTCSLQWPSEQADTR